MWVEKRPLTHFYSQKTRGLLVYLAVEAGRAQTRSHLAGLLWPDYPESRARRNLSQTLTALRKDLGEAAAFVQSTSRTIALNQTRGVVVDVLAFEQGITAVRNHNHPNPLTCFDCTQQMQQTADLYVGSFLDQFTVDDSPLFEHWLEARREQLAQQAIDLLTRLSNSYAAQHKHEEALVTTQRLLALVPWLESAHQQRMLLLAQQGQRTQALAQYELLSDALMDELGVGPSIETDALYDQILAGEIEVVEKEERPVRETAVLPEAERKAPTQVAPYYAPAVTPHFVGREEEMAQLTKFLDSQGGSSNPIALVGMGGIGKTAFATYVAKQLQSRFADGVLWGNSKMGDPHNILDLWARAYGKDFSGISDLDSKAAAMRGMLADKQALVIIDNVDDAALVRPLLPNSAQSVVLLTTRNRDIAATLNAKPLPLIELPPAQSRQLLVSILGEERVFASAEEETAAQKIGEILHHLPLAVEIAAKRLKSRPRMKLAALARRLEDMQQRLGLKISDQAVRASFQVSWEGLRPLSQQVFAAMGVFAGRPFSVSALASVVDIDPFDVEDELFTLMALSLVNEASETHYEQHPLLADFANEKLADDEQAQIASLTRLANYYLTFAQEYGANYVELEPEWDNLTLAIEAAYRLGLWEQVLAFANALADAWRARGGFSQARQIYRLAYEAARKLSEAAPHQREQEAVILLYWGEASLNQNDYDVAQQLLQNSLEIFQMVGNENGIASVKFQLASIATVRYQHDKAIQLLRESEAIFGRLDDKHGLGEIAAKLGFIALVDSRLDEAQIFFEEALGLFQSIDEAPGIIGSYRFLAHVAFGRHDYAEAERLAQLAIKLAETAGLQALVMALLYILIGIYRHQGKLRLAKQCGDDCLKILQYMGQRHTEGLVLRQMSLVHKELGELETAVQLVERSWAIFESLKDKQAGAIALRQLGDLHQARNEIPRAKSAWQMAAEFARELNQQRLLESIQQRLS